jgi:hypothetical protein
MESKMAQIDKALLDAYRYHRINGARYLNASRALENARHDIANAKTRYPSTRDSTLFQPWRGIGTPFESGSSTLRWIEKPESCGLRFVGWADQVADGRRIDHKGWHTNDSCYETLRGIVYQLPARNGECLYISGYAQHEGRGESGPSNGAALCFDRMTCGDMHGTDNGNDSDARDAAYLADSIAEHAAERERDYQECSNKGFQFSELGESIVEARRTILELCNEIKAARKIAGAASMPTICETLRDKVRRLYDEIQTARKEREELRDSIYGKEGRAAFNDGASDTVFTCA